MLSPTRSPPTWSTATSPAPAKPAVGHRHHRAPHREGKLYCAVVLDAYSRRVVGWSIDATPTAALVTNALGMAIQTRTPPGGTVIHSDQGVQFASWAFTQRAKDSGLVPSMRSVGDSYDNAMIEAFWSRIQVELLDRHRWRTRVELANAIFEYLEIFPTTDNDATAASAC
jgi:putative transposase